MKTYPRRHIIKTLGLGAAALTTQELLPGFKSPDPVKSHIITLSFDDGFKKSSIKTARIYEKHNLSACINVIASAHLKGFQLPDEYQDHKQGNFKLWNKILSRGHELMVHSYKHANLTKMPLEDAKKLIQASLDYFTGHLEGFKAETAIFNFPYNASTPEIEAWLATKVRAFRTGYTGFNPFPHKGQQRLTCSAFGPGNTETHLDSEIEKLLELPSGWLIYNTHGLDGEGWGPMRSEYLDNLLGRLKQIDSVAILPVGKALDLAGF